MNPRIVLVQDWPQPDTVTPANVWAGPSALMVVYGTREGEAAVITFPNWVDAKVGAPNDESLNGHPLYKYGLKPYSIHRIENSPWLDELEQQNSVHPNHSSARFLESKVHYIFALKEETVECLVRESNRSSTKIDVFESHRRALQHIKECIDA
jgi:hypothetical protein